LKNLQNWMNRPPARPQWLTLRRNVRKKRR
jgi:hypothetical protein